jgi:hypothetical protein
MQVPYDETRRFGNTLGMLKWQVDGWLELFKLVESGNSCLNSSQSDMPRILGRELSTPLQVAQTVEGPIQSMLEARATLTEKRRLAEEKLEQETSSKLASLQIEKQEETRAAEQKLALRKKAFLDATPTTITGGSLQNKKMGNESSYKKRFLWLDYDSKSLFWAKKEDRVDSKSIVLDKSVAVNVSKDVISLVKSGEASVDIKVSFCRLLLRLRSSYMHGYCCCTYNRVGGQLNFVDNCDKSSHELMDDSDEAVMNWWMTAIKQS